MVTSVYQSQTDDVRVILLKKFNQIYLDLVNDIKEKVYKPGDLLPVELQLAEKYQVSRGTIRKAQRLLIENGYIQKKQGKGATVLDITKFNISGSTLYSFSEIQKAHPSQMMETIVLKNKRERIPEELADRTNLDIEAQVIAIERLRKLNGEAIILDKDYLIAEIIPNIPLTDAQNSILNYVEQVTGVKVSHAHRQLTIEPVTQEDKILLDIGNDAHVAVVRSEVYLEDARLFQIHESRKRVASLKVVDFVRRKNIE